MRELTRKQILWLATLIFLLILLFAHNIKGVLYNCIHAIDFSIYQQAIYEIAAGNSFNPYLTIRNVNIFADHFDPVLMLSVPFIWLFGFHPIPLLVFELLWLVAFLIIIFKTRQFESKNHLLFAFTIVLLSKGLLNGFTYPMHPTMWTIVPVLLMVWAIKEKRDNWLIGSSIALCFFKEIFPFGVFAVGVYYLFKRNWKVSLTLIAFSVTIIYFSFFIRPELFGKGENYNSLILGGLKNDFFNTIALMFKNFHYKRSFKTFYPFIVPIFLVIKNEIKGNKNWKDHFIIPVFFYLVPLFGVHFIPNLLMMHRESTFTAFLLGSIIYSKLPEYLFQKKKLLILVIVIFIASSMGRYTKMFNRVLLSKDRTKCIITDDKRAKSKEIINTVYKYLKPDQTLLSTGGIIPLLLRPGYKIYQSGFFFKANIDFDYLLLERNRSGDTTPYSKELIEEQIQKCENAGVKPLVKNDYFFFAKGPFPSECHEIVK